MRPGNRESLPIGTEIDHAGSTLQIVKWLSGGLTSEVYEGNLFLKDKELPVRVVVKAMKALLVSPNLRQYFLREGETLALLMVAEEMANREQRLNLKITPVYYGLGEFQGNPYLVMELIDGKQVSDLLRYADGGKFPEIQALTATWHLYRTLDVLHRLLRRTCSDLKFENLWWTGGQLKLTDFASLDEIQTADGLRKGVSRDILLAAVYFCVMATGYLPEYSYGELMENINLENLSKTSNISWGVKRELKQLLHRDPAQRPSNAADIAKKLRTLVDFWSRDVDEVLKIARIHLQRAEAAADEARQNNKPLNDDGKNSAFHAYSAFDIVSKRLGEVDNNSHKKDLNMILGSTNDID